MKHRNKNIEAFFALLRAGLWEKDVSLSQYGEIDYAVIMKLAEEQSVVGLIASGLEHVTDIKVPKEWALQYIGSTLQIEQRNRAMNNFIADLITEMRKAGIYALLVKGQGIAQCYERPTWRSSGDIDLLLSEENYNKAKSFLSVLATSVEKEQEYEKHIGYTIGQWIVELHGNLRGDILTRIDNVLDKVRDDIFYGGNVRTWMNGKTQVFLPGVENDTIFVFTHFLDHFFHGGIGLRQICDWCRLIWTFRANIDQSCLEKRIEQMHLMTEWKAFSAFAVVKLGMPANVQPFYSQCKKWNRKANRILTFILKTGNFGHNRDKSYYLTQTYFRRKLTSLYRHTADSFVYLTIFPLDSVCIWLKMFYRGILEVLKIRK